VRLLRCAPGDVDAAAIRAALDAQLRSEALAAEARFISDPATKQGQRPYGWGWVLRLASEVDGWDDDDARRWSGHLAPLTDAVTANFVEWLPKATYPGRYGVHTNTAFGLTLALPYARRRADAGDARLIDAIADAASRWYSSDVEYPAAWEPSGSDFLSPALTEAQLMAHLLGPAEFPAWLERFLPGIAASRPEALFTPAIVSDASDGQIAHLHGLNLSRAACWWHIADALPDGDPRVAVAREAAERHAEAAMPHVAGDDYMVEHWLVTYAVLFLT
jgi:hypothetical protein